MTTDNLKKINAMNDLREIRRYGADLLEGKERKEFQQIRQRFDGQRHATEQLYLREYKTRVEIAIRDLQDKAGSKTREFTPRFYGVDRFNKSDLSRQAQLNVRFDHQQTLARIDSQELKKSKSFLENSTRRKEYREAFSQSAERRRSQTRRESPERRRTPSQTMSD